MHSIGRARANYLKGVLREYQVDQRRPVDQQWIQKIVDLDDGHWIILCCARVGALAFRKQQFLEIDLAFKCVQGKVTVFSLCGFNDRTNRKLSMSLAHTHHTLTRDQALRYIYMPLQIPLARLCTKQSLYMGFPFYRTFQVRLFASITSIVRAKLGYS
jgi:hypothetical protein